MSNDGEGGRDGGREAGNAALARGCSSGCSRPFLLNGEMLECEQSVQLVSLPIQVYKTLNLNPEP